MSGARLLFMTETVFFTTCPGRTAPNFTILLAGSRTKICGKRKRVRQKSSLVNEKNKYDTCILVRQGWLPLFQWPKFLLGGHWVAHSTFIHIKCPQNSLHNYIIKTGLREMKEKFRLPWQPIVGAGGGGWN
jgi:hypothetical protein